MRRGVTAVAFAAAFAAGTQGCFADSGSATVAVQRLFAAFNADSGRRFSETYAPDAVIVDEFAPFVWHGPSAATAFWRSFLALRTSLKISAVHATHGPLAFLSSDNATESAYVVAPTTITDRLAGKAESETGQWVFVVKKIGGAWLIENSSWATVSYSRG